MFVKYVSQLKVSDFWAVHDIFSRICQWGQLILFLSSHLLFWSEYLIPVQWPLKFFKKYLLSAKHGSGNRVGNIRLRTTLLIFFDKFTIFLTHNSIFAGYATIPSSMILRLITSRIFQLPWKDFPIFWELASILQPTTYGLITCFHESGIFYL